MSCFTDVQLEKKLVDLNSSQQSIQTVSLWLIHHRKHHKTIVQIWFRELRKAKPNRKLTFMYLCNDVIQNSKKKGPEFSREFSTVLNKAFNHVYKAVNDEKTKKGLERIIRVWEDRNIYDNIIIQELRDSMMDVKIQKSPAPSKIENKVPAEKRPRAQVPKEAEHVSNKKKKVSMVKEEPEPAEELPPGEPPETEVLIKALMDLENSPSSDADVREKIASLPPEVSDISLLDNIQNRDAALKLVKQVDEACVLLIDYNNRLTEELEIRKLVFKMLGDYLIGQKEQVVSTEKKMEEYRDMLKRVVQVRSELKSHLQNLPDLTLLPSVTGGLAPLPSAGDLFM